MSTFTKLAAALAIKTAGEVEKNKDGKYEYVTNDGQRIKLPDDYGQEKTRMRKGKKVIVRHQIQDDYKEPLWSPPIGDRVKDAWGKGTNWAKNNKLKASLAALGALGTLGGLGYGAHRLLSSNNNDD